MHSNRRCFLGLGAALGAALMLNSMHVPEARADIGVDIGKSTGNWMLVRYDENHVPQVIATGDDFAFVDGVYDVPGGAELKAFYHDLYRPMGGNRTVAAMQPDNGAGQVSGDRALSVGKGGDLKAARPDGVKSGTTPGAKAVDARKTSWLRPLFSWALQPVPS